MIASEPVESAPLTGVRLLAAIAGTELFGNELSTIEALKSIRASGGQVRVMVTESEDNPVRDELHRLDFTTLPVPFGAQFSKKWLLKHPTMPLYYARRILNVSRRFVELAKDFDATHYMLGNLTAFGYLALAWRRVRGRLIYVMHDCPAADSRFNLWMWKKAVQRADSLVCVSNFVATKAKAAGAANPTVIYNRDAEHSSRAGGLQRNPKNEPAGLVYLGSVAEHKGLMVLVDAFDLLKDEIPELSLEIIGGSRYDSAFRERLVQKISSLGHASRIRLLGYLRDPSGNLCRASVHIAPSVWEEPMGMVVLEAKREATPSIVFDSGGLPEMIEHKVDGYICREKTPEALADAIRWMLAQPDRLRRLREAARRSYEKEFSPKIFDKRWQKLLEETHHGFHQRSLRE